MAFWTFSTKKAAGLDKKNQKQCQMKENCPFQKCPYKDKCSLSHCRGIFVSVNSKKNKNIKQRRLSNEPKDKGDYATNPPLKVAT
jgi:hypothetical protein